ncbi:MAG: hypothetical protein ACREM8_03570 [Vulcanimicrobiaceae bacterium]
MIRRSKLTDVFALAAIGAVLALGSAASAATDQTATATAKVPANLPSEASALLKRMTQLNTGLRSYKADLHAEIALKTFPFISPSLDGNVYYKAPDQEAAVFDTVPALASQFKKVYPRIPAPMNWPKIYTITTLGDSGGLTTFRLVPIKNGRVERLDVKVDDANATIASYIWTYKDGGSISFQQSFKTIDGNYLVDKQVGHVDLPAYKADVTNVLSNYKLNVPVADSVFAES